MDLVEGVYLLTRSFPNDEKYGLVSQLRRAAVSIPSNIAEGNGRTHRGDYLRHLSFAQGSLCELETQLIIAGRLTFASKEDVRPVWQLAQEIGRMLSRMVQKLRDPKEAHRPEISSPSPLVPSPSSP